MKYFISVVFMLALPGCAGSSKTSNRPSESENALLWEVSGKGLTQPSYLYGTIHMICPEDFLLGDSLKSAFGQAAKIYLELDMDDPSIALKTLQLSMLKNGSLKDLMAPASYEQLSNFVQDSLQMPMMVFNKMKPFALMSVLYTRVLPCSKPESYEQTFVQWAGQQRKEILGLEKLEEQFAVFDQIPDTTEARMVLDMIRDFNGQRSEFRKMTEAYKRKDLQALGGLMEESPDMKGYEDLLLVNRNRNWIPVMQAAMSANRCFFAVGAGHLPGQEGVIALLRKAGYQVRPLE
jgi:uncharacterized protein YbaP (TraB family)